MKRFMMRSLVVCAVVFTLGIGSGCAALLLTGLGVGAGIAGTAYYEGKLTSSLDAKPEAIQSAVEAAFKELGIKLVSSTSNSLTAKVTGTTAENNSVTVTAELEKTGQSKLGIRVGAFGDKPLSQKIYSTIVKKLPEKKK